MTSNSTKYLILDEPENRDYYIPFQHPLCSYKRFVKKHVNTGFA